MQVRAAPGAVLRRAIAALAVTVVIVGGTSRWSPSAQQSEPSLGVQFHGFTDSRGVTVLSPDLDLQKDFTDRTSLRARFGVDAISAASDSCVRCHQEGARNLRTFVNAAVTRKRGDLSISAGGEYSKERFYEATTALGSVSRTFNRANTTVAGGYSYSWNRPTLHPSEFVESQRAQTAFASLTQTLSRTTIAQVGYEVSSIRGYQSNPYLRATVDGIRIVGEAPSERLRQSATIRVRQALPGAFYAEGDLRRYSDDWRLTATTYSLGLTFATARWAVTGKYRHHDQSGTYFFAPTYSGNPTYFTADFRLFPFDSRLYTGQLTYTPRARLLGVWPQGTAVTAQYEFYDASNGFQAATFSSGLRVPLPK